MKNNFRKLIVIFGLSFFYSTNCAKKKEQELAVSSTYNTRMHECVKNLRGGSYKNEHLAQCVKNLKLMKNKGLKIEPHKMAKRVNNEIRKTTELLALTKRPRKGFFDGAKGFFQKSRLSIYFRALLNSIWDDLKGNDVKVFTLINKAVEESPNEILKKQFNSRWLNFFKSGQKDQSIDSINRDRANLELLVKSYGKVGQSIDACMNKLNPKDISTLKTKDQFLEEDCQVSKIIPEHDNAQFRFAVLIGLLNRILERARKKDARFSDKNQYFGQTLSNFFHNVFIAAAAMEKKGVESGTFKNFLKNIKISSIKNEQIKDNFKYLMEETIGSG